MAPVTIRQALQHVADYPGALTDEIIQMPAYELLARTLFDISNRPDVAVKASLPRANRARKMILDRMEGKRRAGTRPVTPNRETLVFVDLTGGVLDAAEPAPRAQPLDG